MQTQLYNSISLKTIDYDILIVELLQELESLIETFELNPKNFTSQPSRHKKFENYFFS